MKPALRECLAAVLSRRLEGFDELLACDRLSGGASQETYRVEVRAAGRAQRLALRRAPGGGGIVLPGSPGMRTEALLMQCARAAGVPEPAVLHVLEPDEGLGEGFLMEWLEGETLGARIVKAPELAGVRPRLAYQCGEILARLHGIDLEETGLGARLQRVRPADFVNELWLRYRGFDTPQPMIDYTARWLLDHLPPETPPALVHNDFRNGNLMVGSEGVVAVLDWELAHVGDPMRDLGWLCTPSWRFGRSDLPVGGFGRREDLFAGYAAVTGRPVDPEHVRFWEIFGSFWWAVGCLTMTELHRKGLDPSVERVAIGRRSSECQVDCVNQLLPGPVEPIDAPGGPLGSEMPRVDELLASVRDFLRGPVMDASRGRVRFLARVGANALDIALRDLATGPAHRARELERLRALLGSPDADLERLRRALVAGLRSGAVALDLPGLGEHLRATVVNQIAIDQPGYPGLRTACDASRLASDSPQAGRPSTRGPSSTGA